MQKLPIGKYFGAMTLLWGVVTTCMAATNSFATLATCRFFLGAFETCLSPILTVLVGQYWTRKEQPLRASIWWAGGGIGSFIADGITYGVSGSSFSGSKYAVWQVCNSPFEIYYTDSVALDYLLDFWAPDNWMGNLFVLLPAHLTYDRLVLN
jgi:MFS family permease